MKEVSPCQEGHVSLLLIPDRKSSSKKRKSMSRTYRNVRAKDAFFRYPKTTQERRAIAAEREDGVFFRSKRKRLRTSYDDIHIAANYELSPKKVLDSDQLKSFIKRYERVSASRTM